MKRNPCILRPVVATNTTLSSAHSVATARPILPGQKARGVRVFQFYTVYVKKETGALLRSWRELQKALVLSTRRPPYT